MNVKIVSILIFITFYGVDIYSQSNITGKVVDPKNEGLEYVSIVSKGGLYTVSADGGSFILPFPADSTYIWVNFSSLGYKEKSIKLYKGERNITIVLQEDISLLDEVLVRPSKYSRFSNYSAQTTKLSSFEIVTNPNALGDIIGGVKIIPGVQSNDNDGRLIINGGSTNESQIYVDGLIMFNPYTLSQKNVSVRSRLSPDLFSGVSLYSGGYSSQYGNALSGVLQLNTLSIDDLVSKIDINVNSTGVESSLIKKKKNSAYRGNVSYMNLEPYGRIVKDDYDWNKYYNQFSTNHYYERKISNAGYLKSYLYYSLSSTDYSYENIDKVRFENDLYEQNLYGSVISNFKIADKWSLYIGSNVSYNRFTGTDVSIKEDAVKDEKINSHSKLSLSYRNGNITNSFGFENLYSSFDELYRYQEDYNMKYVDNLVSCFNDFSLITNKFNFNIGLRGEYSTYLKKANIAPRAYVSYKQNSNNIFSFTVGQYYQMPDENYLKYHDKLSFKKSWTTTLSYSFVKGSSKFQADLFYKKYDNLLTYTKDSFYYENIENDGRGDVKGLNLFWRKNYRNFESWISYSYTDANIKYGFIESHIQPDYLAKNNLNITTKYWIGTLKSMLGCSFHFDSGATYYKNTQNAIAEKSSPNRTRLDLSWSYLPTKGVIIHLSCQNVLGRKNIYGYEYSAINAAVKPITNPGKQFFYVGVFITLSKSNINQLKSL